MFMKRSKLAQNAYVCREIILRRRPDLVSTVGTDRGSPNTRRAPVLLYENEKVLSCEAIFKVEPEIDIHSCAEEFIDSRSWSTDQIGFSSGCEDPESHSRWDLCFNLGLEHVRTGCGNWFGDVLAIVHFVDSVRTECSAVVSIDVWRFHEQVWCSQHLAMIDESHNDWVFLKGMIEQSC
jgi:hypothetical protein